jgi:hypothetical protein
VTLPRWLQTRRRSRRADVPGQTRRFHNREARYENGRLHAACWPPELAAQCRLCAGRKDEPHLWFASRSEAEVAFLLDHRKRQGEIAGWRRGEKLVLVQAIRGVQRAITYTPDFLVTLADGTEEVWEVKPKSCVCARCYTPPPGKRRPPQLIAEDAMLKIKLFRAHDPRPLRIVDKHARPLHV